MKASYLFVKCAVVFSMAATLVHAQGFYWNTASARSMALGGVYLPSSGGVTDALASNPAGLALAGSRTIDLSLTSIFARGSFSNSVNTNAPLNDSPGVVPYGAFGTPIGHSRFSIGVGLVPELTSVSNWNYVDAPGVAGASYGLQKQKSAIVAARSVAGLGFALNKKLSLGVSVGAVYNTNTLETPYVFQSYPALAGLKTLVDLHTAGVGWNTSVGLIANPTDRVQFNVAWKSRTTINSSGDANGNIGVQLAALGMGGARPDFHYAAGVQNVLPQSVLAGVNWRVDGHWIFALQSDWTNWKDSFASLPVSLTNGNNADINGLLGSNAIFDRVPLNWKDQYSFRGGVERFLTENIILRGGYAHANNPVPASTLSPLTAAIMGNQLSTGIGYRHNHWRFDLGYGFDPTAQENVGKTALLSGEYANSKVRIGTQSLGLNTSYQF
ncbi:MAG TPA: outer membrane protein transport protein [Bryobacteraceae bacterium]|nr:outer membrane protein transport protein [Bryobacteraceae bacterium]